METSGQLNAPAALSRGKSPSYLLDRRLGGPQSRSGRSANDSRTVRSSHGICRLRIANPKIERRGVVVSIPSSTTGMFQVSVERPDILTEDFLRRIILKRILDK
jgi:hypothetical protein